MNPLVERQQSLRRAEQEGDPEQDYREEILDLFRDYRHTWDVLSELIQNAVDAINAGTDDVPGLLSVEVRPDERTLVVEDNGIGIPAAKLREVLLPKVSLNKQSSRTYGYKGVGLSFVSHLARRFEIESVHDGIRSRYVMEDAARWVAGVAGATFRETTPEPETASAVSGTRVVVELEEDYGALGLRVLQSLNDFFEWARRPKVMEYVLRTRTAAGNTRTYLQQEPQRDVDVKVVVAGEDELGVPYRYLSPFDSEYSSVSQYFLDKPLGRQLPYRNIFLNPKLKDSSKSFRALRHDVYDLVVGARPETTFDLSVLVCGETGVTQLEKQYGIPELPDMVRQSFESDTGVFLSINGMPTGIQLYKWTGGTNKRYMCLVDVGMEANGELDKGRKGISAHTRNLIVQRVEEELHHKTMQDRYSLAHAALHMRENQSRGYAGTDFRKHLEKWEAMPDVSEGMLIRKAPLDENAVLILFGELIGLGVLDGYELRYVSQDAAFDFGFHFRMSRDRLDTPHDLTLSEGYVDQLGYDIDAEGGYVLNNVGYRWHVGEFKIAAEDIVARSKQPLQSLDLLVVWDYDEDELVKKGGVIMDVTPDERKFEGVTHLLSDGSGDCQVICLRALLERVDVQTYRR